MSEFKRVTNSANIITISRLAAALLLILPETFSPAFYGMYLYCGISDMIDGPIARKTGSESRLGERLDSGADLIFIIVCLYKILPELVIPEWLWIWTAVIAAIKVLNLICGYIYRHDPAFLHTTANRVTGFMLFLAAFLVKFIPIEQIGAVLCVTASFAAVQEGHFIRTGRGTGKGASKETGKGASKGTGKGASKRTGKGASKVTGKKSNKRTGGR